MTLKEALDIFNRSPISKKEEIERYVPCSEGMVFITKSQEEVFNFDDDDDDFVIGDVIYLLIRPNGKIELTTPADVDYDSNDIKFLN